MTWAVVGGSVTGRGHRIEGQDCQDAHCWRTLDRDAVIAVVCDGAGSHSRSGVGAQWVSRWICDDPALDGWVSRLFTQPPKALEASWREIAQTIFSRARKNLELEAAKESSFALEDFSCTAILVLVTSEMVAVAHVGDGRGCAKFSSSEWFAILEPSRGGAPNETIFLTTDYELGEQYWTKAASVFLGSVEGFALMTDGCEMGAFECWVPKIDGIGFHDPNLPHSGFFNPVMGSLVDMVCSGMDEAEVTLNWLKFLENGVPRFSVESDDRTMIVGALLPGTTSGV